VGQVLATEAIAKCVRSGGIWEAESNMESLGLVSDIQAIFRRRRHQPRRPPLAKIRPGKFQLLAGKVLRLRSISD
jgi:hypothetical protein